MAICQGVASSPRDGHDDALPKVGLRNEKGAETMAHDLRFQVIILPNAPWDELLKRFTHVEELGFDLVTTGDHFVDWNNPSIPWLEAWTVLAAVAREMSTPE
jgi:alkanesulfonate monooxygenase SsuD/methylene tetrahydromethanopterin reductase-like flavin-dependent oxidoreductase (luciferase family)